MGSCVSIFSLAVMFFFQSRKGLVLVRTTTLLIVASYNENMYPSVCVEAVEKLGKAYRENHGLS